MDSTSSQTWHAQPAADACRVLESSPDGLDVREAERRLSRYGLNRINPAPPVSALRMLADQFRSVVIALLIGATLLSIVLGDYAEAGAIALVVVVNAAMGFAIEFRARRAMEALRSLSAMRASVWRGGALRSVDAELLVPGDVVELAAGQRTPADGRILSEADLRVDEAALTGESLATSKNAAVVDGDTPLADRRNMVYQGTMVVAGVARVLVTATGSATEVGRIGALTGALADEPTPLERRLDDLGRRLAWIAVGTALVVGALGLAHGEPWALMVQTSIALAVAAVPEGLPAVTTIALAIGLHRLSKRHTLVRRLPVVEALGSTTVICTDKTRTLTSGDMTVVRVWSPGGIEAHLDEPSPHHSSTIDVVEAASLASRWQAPSDGGAPGGVDPIDRAVLVAAARLGLDVPDDPEHPAVVVPFSSERKFMAAIRPDGDRLIAFAKGAPRRIVEMSGSIRLDGIDRPLDPIEREALLQENQRLARAGLRVLGVAKGPVAAPSTSALTELTFLGFIGLMDPPADGVRHTIAQLRHAGLRTVMLTGDQHATAEAVGRSLGILNGAERIVDARELAAWTRDDLARALPHISGFSRITPDDKLRIVAALQDGGAVVAMIGDGVNDAPALRKADVGVAMGGRGTDVAKEAASIVLQDDRFETLAAAVEEGRVIFDNIRKFVFFLFSCNLAEVLVVLSASLAGMPLPLLPLPILWLNLVTDTFPALALAVEPGDPSVMARQPRDPHRAILSKGFMGRVVLHATVITASTLAAYVWALEHASEAATTIAFITLGLAQTFHLGNARSAQHVLSSRAALANRSAIGAVALSVLLLLVAVYVPPLAAALRVTPLTTQEWLVVGVCSAIPAVFGQLWKWLLNRE